MALSPRKQRERETRKQVILNAARMVFFEKGFQAATMEEIAQSAGFSKGAIYFYYKSKEEILVQINCDLMEAYRQRLEQRIRETPSLEEVVKGLLQDLRSVFDSYLVSLDNLVYFSPGSQPLNVPPELDDRWQRAITGILDLLQELLDRAGGETGRTGDSLQYAVFALSMGLGIFQMSKVRNEELRSRIDVRAQFDILEEVVFNGLMKGQAPDRGPGRR